MTLRTIFQVSKLIDEVESFHRVSFFIHHFLTVFIVSLKIGPGSYQSKVGIFEKTATLSGMSSKDKFFTIDNGHVNIRP